ncbi:MAG: SpoVG family protein [Sphaerochaetaceae bacterium]|nr:SpoVG family protein [Sphaerochaetaceae bacterium]
MVITDIKIRKVSDTEQLRAFATVVFDSVLVVHNLKIVSTGDKLIIAMPSRLVNNGEFKDIVHPINSEFRQYISKEILKAYNETA